MKTKQHDIGVIVGRFQLDDLHSAHRQLIQDVSSRHERCLILIGVSHVLGSKEHPLDYTSREMMIKTNFPNVFVMPILDNRSDKVWSETIDTLVRSVFPLGSVCLYGGRDSFIPYYSGKFDCYEFPLISHQPATEIRKEIGKLAVASSDFRKGVIYSTQNQFPRVFTTIDIAILRDIEMPFQFLLGKKKDQTQWRFPGGFIDKNETLEEVCIREAKEETGIDLLLPKYLMSKPIKDWRYCNTSDGVMSCFFVGVSSNKEQVAVAGDDLVEVKWFSENDKNIDIVGEHQDFLNCLYQEFSKMKERVKKG